MKDRTLYSNLDFRFYTFIERQKIISSLESLNKIMIISHLNKSTSVLNVQHLSNLTVDDLFCDSKLIIKEIV